MCLTDTLQLANKCTVCTFAEWCSIGCHVNVLYACILYGTGATRKVKSVDTCTYIVTADRHTSLVLDR